MLSCQIVFYLHQAPFGVGVVDASGVSLSAFKGPLFFQTSGSSAPKELGWEGQPHFRGTDLGAGTVHHIYTVWPREAKKGGLQRNAGKKRDKGQEQSQMASWFLSAAFSKGSGALGSGSHTCPHNNFPFLHKQAFVTCHLKNVNKYGGRCQNQSVRREHYGHTLITEVTYWLAT